MAGPSPLEYSWFRCYNETIRNIKLRRVPPSWRWAWIAALTLARESNTPGVLILEGDVPCSIADLADAAAITKGEAKKAISYLIQQEMMAQDGDTYLIVNWAKYQHDSDFSTQRTREWRERKVQQVGDVTGTSQSRHRERSGDGPGDVPVTPSEYRVQSTEDVVGNCEVGGSGGKNAASPPPKDAKPDRKTRIPKGWEPSPELIGSECEKAGVDVDTFAAETERFLYYYREGDGKATRHANWPRTFQDWMGRAHWPKVGRIAPQALVIPALPAECRDSGITEAEWVAVHTAAAVVRKQLNGKPIRLPGRAVEVPCPDGKVVTCAPLLLTDGTVNWYLTDGPEYKGASSVGSIQ